MNANECLIWAPLSYLSATYATMLMAYSQPPHLHAQQQQRQAFNGSCPQRPAHSSRMQTPFALMLTLPCEKQYPNGFGGGVVLLPLLPPGTGRRSLHPLLTPPSLPLFPQLYRRVDR